MKNLIKKYSAKTPEPWLNKFSLYGGKSVYITDINIGILRDIQYSIPNNISTMISNRGNIESVLS